ncbi:MAG: hypothetical protein MR866_07075, partial [Selenomonadaceae bacterium]|nr:hypothetical protein [Selenomonadaceae bacterium]
RQLHQHRLRRGDVPRRPRQALHGVSRITHNQAEPLHASARNGFSYAKKAQAMQGLSCEGISLEKKYE